MPKNPIAGPTLADIARQAEVSLATVDRVLNGRTGVSDRTHARVMRAAQHLGYVAPDEAGPLPVRLAFVLPEGTNSFVHDLAAQVTEQAAWMENVTATVELVSGFDPAALVARLRALDGRIEGVAMLAVDHPLVREAVRGLVQRGLPVVTLGSDVRVAGHLGYIGIDDMQAGRLAGYLLGRLNRKPAAKVAFFAGSLSYRGHLEREMGFRQILGQEFPQLSVVAQREVQDDRALAEREMRDMLRAHPDLDAVYNAGGGTAGIAAALTEAGRADKVLFIAHDATQGNKQRLLDGTLDAVIDQNARQEIREALSALTHAARGTPYRMVPPRLQIIFRENLPGG